jgi:hypothetical protein
MTETRRTFDGAVNGDQVSWKVSITDPMPMTLEFTGTVKGDEVTGSVILGDVGTSSFSGTRSRSRINQRFLVRRMQPSDMAQVAARRKWLRGWTQIRFERYSHWQ